MSKILGAVEIGTHKAKAMVGVLSPAGDLNVVSAASVRNEGVRKGEIVDYRKSASAVHAAIEEAESLVRRGDLEVEWGRRRDRMLAEKIDVTAFIARLVESFADDRDCADSIVESLRAGG